MKICKYGILIFLLPMICLLAFQSHVAAMQKEPTPEGKRPDERPDLIAVRIVQTPDVPPPESRIQIMLEVRNRGREPVEDVKLRLMINGNALPEKIVTVPAEGTIMPLWDWSVDQGGRYTLHAVVDPDFQILERNRSDNSITKELMITEDSPDIDFEILDIAALRERDRPQRVRIRIRNNGKMTAKAPISVLMDGDVVADRLSPALQPGGVATIEIPVGGLADISKLTAQIRVGRHKIERRLSVGDTKTRKEAKPDLVLSDLSIHAALPEPGQSRLVTVNFSIRNQGALPAAVPFRTRIDPGTVGRDGMHPVFIETNALVSGAVTYLSHTIENAPEEFDIQVHVDEDDALNEEDEGNNRKVAQFKNPVPMVHRWLSIGPSRITDSKAHGYAWNDAVGRLAAIAIHPTQPDTMYVGGQGSGIWKTTTGGSSWFPLTDHIDVSVAALCLDPVNPAKLYWATARRGFYVSLNAGSSWTQVSQQDLESITHGGILLVNPNTPNVLFLNSTRGVYRSLDGGVTWTLSLGGGSATGLVMSTSDPGTLFAAIFHKTEDTTAGIYTTSNSGDTWRKITGCPGGTLPPQVAGTKITLARSGQKFFAGFRSKDNFQLFKTSTSSCSIGGRNEHLWEKGWMTSTDQGVLWSGMWADPTNADYLYLGGTYFWRSTDGGMSFEMTSGQGSPPDSAHVDHHGFAVRPGSPNVIYTLNDGGIYRSNDRGKKSTWSFLGKGIYNTEFYHMGLSGSDTNYITGGTQDNGTLRYTGPSTVWRMIRGGDGATVAIAPNDSRVHYSMNQYASSIAKWNQAKNKWDAMAKGLPTGATCFNLRYILHPKKVDTLLAPCTHDCTGNGCSGGLWRITSPTGDWSVILPEKNAAIDHVAVDARSEVHYAGTNRGSMYAGLNGSGWKTVFTHPSAFGFSDIEVDPDNPGVLYGGFATTGIGRIYRFSRGTVPPTQMLAQDITSDLPPGLRINSLAIDRMNPLTVYAGTGKGVYRGRSSDGGNSWFWVAYNDGLPLADVRELAVHPVTGVMRAATHGRGAFEANTDHPIGSVLSVSGKLKMLRVHDVGTKYGPPDDQLDVEVVTQLDTVPGKAYGFKLRQGASSTAQRMMLDELRSAFRRDQKVHLEYVRTGIRHGEIFRVIRMP